MQKLNSKKGFTLIELLVVVAIIGILASVVMASLNSARKKGVDAAIKSVLANARSQAALLYDDSAQKYDGVCDLVPTTLSTHVIGPMVLNAYQRLNPAATDINNILTIPYAWDDLGGALDSATCHVAADGMSWAAIVSLKLPANPSGGWCVDSTGASKEVDTLGDSITACP